jgi:hypothetical protein
MLNAKNYIPTPPILGSSQVKSLTNKTSQTFFFWKIWDTKTINCRNNKEIISTQNDKE